MNPVIRNDGANAFVKRDGGDSFPFRSLFGMLAAVAALAFALSGCTADERVAGGDDFPNSVETLGKSAATERDEDAAADDWNAYDDAPSTPPEMYDSTRGPDAPPEEEEEAPLKAAAEALSRATAQPDDRIPPGREIAGAVRSVTREIEAPGLARAIRVQVIAGVTARDTTWYSTDSLLPLVAQRVLRVAGEVAYAAGRTERFSFEDADGDSVLSGRPGSRNLTRARFTVEYANGRVEERVVVMGAGPDRLFETPEDNGLLSLDLVQYKDGDTLERLSLRPVAPDSLVRAPGRDSGLVETEHMVVVGGARVTRRYRTAVFADSARNRPLRFTRVRETAGGTYVTEARGRDSLPDFAPGDTGVIVDRFVPADSTDTLASVRTVRRVRLSGEAGGRAGDRLLRIERSRTYRAGAVASSRWILRPAAPGRPGDAVRAGTAELRLELRDGGWVEFVGDADSSGFFGTWTDSRGDAGTVRFDVSGALE